MAKFLVVDDSALARRVLCDILLSEGHAVEQAESGEKAMKLVGDRHFDAVLADFNMPGMMGDALLAGIRRIAPGMPVVLVTSYYDSEMFRTADKSGFVRIVNKPFTNEELVDAIREIL